MNFESIISRINIPAIDIYYGSNKLVPSPLIDWSVDSTFNPLGIRQASTNKISLTGSVLIVPSGSYEQMFVKQQAMRDAFAIDYQDFAIYAGPGNKTLPQGTVISSGLKPRVINIDISPDIQVIRFDYKIDLEAIVPASGVSGVVSNLSNQWTFTEEQDSGTVKLVHAVNAEGLADRPDKFFLAQAAVKPLLGISQLPIDIPYYVEPNASGGWGFLHPSNPSGGPIFEISVSREEVADVANGTYSVTEVFTIVSGVPFFYTARTESFEEDANGIATVTLAGTVQGLGRTLAKNQPPGAYGFARAVSGFFNQIKPNLPFDASGVYSKYKAVIGSGLNLNNPTAFSITQSEYKGTVDFSITYTDSPLENLPSGIASRTITVSTVEGLRLFSSIPIPFRRLGNILQDIRTTTESTVSIQCQVQAKNTTNRVLDTNRAIKFCQDEINRIRGVYANPADFITLRLGSINQSNDDTNLSCSTSVEYIGTIDLSNVQSPNSDISLRMTS